MGLLSVSLFPVHVTSPLHPFIAFVFFSGFPLIPHAPPPPPVHAVILYSCLALLVCVPRVFVCPMCPRVSLCFYPLARSFAVPTCQIKPCPSPSPSHLPFNYLSNPISIYSFKNFFIRVHVHVHRYPFSKAQIFMFMESQLPTFFYFFFFSSSPFFFLYLFDRLWHRHTKEILGS